MLHVWVIQQKLESLSSWNFKKRSPSLNSKIQKYSPTESAKVYDKAVNRKNNVNFHPRQTLDFIFNNMSNATLTEDVKRRIVKQYLDVSNKAADMFQINPCKTLCYNLFDRVL